jgi:hypothetical protein
MKRILQAMDGVATKPVAGANDMKKFLQAVSEKPAEIVNEGANPHKVSLPVQMAMQHYQTPKTPVERKPRVIDKYFAEAEAAILQRKEEKRALINQYASVIAERVRLKESKKLKEHEAGWGRAGMAGVGLQRIEEADLEVLRQGDNPDDYDSIQFKIDGRPIEHGSEEFDHYYKLIFKKNPPGKIDDFVDTLKGMMSEPPEPSPPVDLYKDSENDVQDGDVIIPSHEKGEWVKVRDIAEMSAHLRNDPEGHTIIPHGGMGSGKEETWKSISINKLQQVIEMINAGNYTGAEHTLYKAGYLQGAVTALARYEEFKTKQGKRRMKAGKEVDLGE